MDKLVKSICDYFPFRNTTKQKMFYGLIGFLVVLIFWVMSTNLLNYVKSKPVHIAAMDGVYQIVFFIISLYCLWYGVKYFATLILEIIILNSLPKFNDPGHSIQALMTSLVNDELRLHNEIMKYLSKNKTAKDFAVLHIWLYGNGLICTNEQKAFLEALSTDKGTIDVISHASLCDAETTVQSWISKSKNGGELGPEAFPFLKKYHDLDKIMGVYRIA